MRISKKLISVVLALVLVLGSAVAAFADSDEYLYDVQDDGTGSITAYTGTIEDGVFTIIDEDDFLELPLTAVADGAFEYDDTDSDLAFLEDVTKLVVEAGIANIGERAFAALPNLTEVEFKGDVTLGAEAFADCAALQTVTFGGNVYLGESAFAGCEALETLNTTEDVVFDAEKNALNDTAWFKAYTVDFITIGTNLILYKGADAEETIPLNITNIGAYAFEGNKTLQKINITSYVTRIGNNAFANCTALEEVDFAKDGKVTEVGDEAFLNTPYYNDYEGEFFIVGDILVKYKRNDVPFVKIPNTVREIADDAFDGCYTYNERDGYTFVISSIVVPASATQFGDNSFTLATFEDGTTYSPRIYAYSNTPAMEALKAAGYVVTEMPSVADIDCDGSVTAADARLALRIAVRLDDADDLVKAAADVDGDGSVTSADARFILRMAVGLEEVTPEQLLYMPKTETELLMAYTEAVKKAIVENVGYTKTCTSNITKTDVNLAHKSKLTNVAKLGGVNSKNVYVNDTALARENLIMPSLISTANIKSTSSIVKDGKYYITIVFEDVEDAYITVDSPEYTPSKNYIGKIMPVTSGQVFYNGFSAYSWFNNLVPDDDSRTMNCLRKYALTYVAPTVTFVVDAESGRAESISLSLTYRFAVDGRVNMIDISSKGFKRGDGIVERLDKITFTNFQW